MSDPAPRLAPRPDLPALARRFQDQGRVQVPGLLLEPAARRLQACLEREIPWQTVFRHKDRHVDLHRVQVDSLDTMRRNVLSDAVYAQARFDFTYLYNNYPIADAHAAGLNQGLYVNRLYEFLNGPDFLDFARRLTGLGEIDRVDAQATLYRAGHFLTLHSDRNDGEQRLAAYVLNLTPGWNADWGGLLLFHGQDGGVEAGFTPAFNVLTVFRVPTPHAVSFVVPHCPAGRYSITGWLRRG